MNIRVFRAIYAGFIIPTKGPDVELSVGRMVLIINKKVMIRDNDDADDLDDEGSAEWHEALVDPQFVIINERLFEEVFSIQRPAEAGVHPADL